MSQTSYFKPLRRKLGVLTLVVASVFAVGWVRTFYYTDSFLWNDQEIRFNTASDHGRLWVSRGPMRSSDKPAFRLRLGQKRTSRIEDPTAMITTWRWDWGGFHALRQFDFVLILFPYWSIVIPLTLLSAWLLLSRPRVKTEAPITPTIETA